MYYTFYIDGKYVEIYFTNIFSYDDKTETMTLLDGTKYLIPRSDIKIIFK